MERRTISPISSAPTAKLIKTAKLVKTGTLTSTDKPELTYSLLHCATAVSFSLLLANTRIRNHRRSLLLFFARECSPAPVIHKRNQTTPQTRATRGGLSSVPASKKDIFTTNDLKTEIKKTVLMITKQSPLKAFINDVVWYCQQGETPTDAPLIRDSRSCLIVR